jgi:hypothetical protein
VGANGDREAAAAALDAALTAELPATVEIGAGTVLLLEGRLDPRGGSCWSCRPASSRVSTR